MGTMYDIIPYDFRPEPGEELAGTIYSTSSLLLSYIILVVLDKKKNITHVITIIGM